LNSFKNMKGPVFGGVDKRQCQISLKRMEDADIR